eukprot:Phypoly_transcript_14938.p1 GENE.Phypoly_transcript_14938~~Phypoly_transcript_14938.p1  ORF type:complete len:191 (+),score=29.20 Phypoly_transcript_14938:278-850(+)
MKSSPKKQKLVSRERGEGNRERERDRYGGAESWRRDSRGERFTENEGRGSPWHSRSRSRSPLPRSDSTTTTSTTPTTPSSTSSAVKDIVMEQRAAGNFTASVLKIAGNVQISTLRAHCPLILSSLASDLIDLILITAYICGIFHMKYTQEKDKWEMIEKKAISWIHRQCQAIKGAKALKWSDFIPDLGKL